MSNHQSVELTLVVPAYNEEGCIEEFLQDWFNLLESLKFSSYRIIVVNDGSKDQTGTILDRLGLKYSSLIVVHQSNGGHGKALLTGYQKALDLNSEWIFQVDSDNEFVPQDFLKLWKERQRSPFILGHRLKRAVGPERKAISLILRSINTLAFGSYVVDTNVPFRLINGGYLKKLLPFVPENCLIPNVFLSLLAKKQDKDLLHLPIEHRGRTTGQVSLVKLSLIKFCLRCFQQLLAFRFGPYRGLPAGQS